MPDLEKSIVEVVSVAVYVKPKAPSNRLKRIRILGKGVQDSGDL